MMGAPGYNATRQKLRAIEKPGKAGPLVRGLTEPRP